MKLFSLEQPIRISKPDRLYGFISPLLPVHDLTLEYEKHDVNQAVRYSDTIMVMKNGEMLMAGVPEEVITEQAMKDIYGVNVAIRREEETGLIVVPLSIV
ncbi:ABC-type cobalamin/Fe3+-siderophores transport system ATPase subunit [Paenibacillus castaneae]|uniref:ABC transporter ATP-binding protein n=1 Tax=Paenibacillus castaneae TaxID=474957 RepID=UPI000C9C49D5|nr:ABC transporter ATP-binding protein [Paenibacillus castaneae]NIK78683.1 ABC-type cobalamin/Fe3+-siderophores transport system ATPase subunit [Paenibacillus castaneae]